MTSASDGRWIHLEGTANTRDLGGLPTTDGGRTLPNRILRSDNLQTLSDADVQLLVEKIGLREVIDLRTSAEVLLEGRGPLRALPEVVHRHFTLLPERGQYTDVFAAEEDEVPDLPSGWLDSLLPRHVAEHDEGEPAPVRSYLGYLSQRGDAVVEALRALAAQTEGASVVHCAAGKDRTGVVVALTLAVAGVPHEEIAIDYGLSGNVIDAIIARLRATPTYGGDTAQRNTADHAPRRETMDRVLELLDERYGGPIGWLETHGFGADEQAALRARLRD
ncbi:Protein tyrosine/serine phosphatase [Blastococcus aurantiacus]|uniref:Protein tyrosine/serine phosphatase n=1 Tax=Blastococcus aurantiacus TaxID=1550231 RepID=A0A1G7NNP7_9ACTN|nr:tyrosine-protein phosphatase [Blastococcus aurantiacus]SDF75612.1 Protein tyrosine/serine phosphatase [Blastococcus aurantiacus]